MGKYHFGSFFPSLLGGRFPEDFGIQQFLNQCRWEERRSVGEGAVGCSDTEYQILYEIVRIMKPAAVLEIGCGRGVSGTVLGLLTKINRARFVRVDLQDDAYCSTFIAKDRVRYEFHQQDSAEFFKSTEDKFDLIFVDGDHRERAAGKDFTAGIAHLAPEGVLIAHDISHPGSEYLAHELKVRAKAAGLSTILLDNCGHGLGFVVDGVLPEAGRTSRQEE